MWYVYSTLTNSHKYTNWAPPAGPGQLQQIIGKPVLIQGGANLADKNQFTPLGVRTEVTDEQYQYLLANTMFKRHLDAGHLIVKDERQEADEVAMEMHARDAAAPLTPKSEIFQGTDVESVKPAGLGERLGAAVRSILH